MTYDEWKTRVQDEPVDSLKLCCGEPVFPNELCPRCGIGERQLELFPLTAGFTHVCQGAHNWFLSGDWYVCFDCGAVKKTTEK